MGNGGGGGGHANSNLYKRDRVGAVCNWTTHFLMGLTVLVRLMVKGWPELKISNGPPNALTDPALPEHPDTGSQSEYLKKFVLVKLTVATLSNLGVVNGFVWRHGGCPWRKAWPVDGGVHDSIEYRSEAF
jgi:hypothetical protein